MVQGGVARVLSRHSARFDVPTIRAYEGTQSRFQPRLAERPPRRWLAVVGREHGGTDVDDQAVRAARRRGGEVRHGDCVISTMSFVRRGSVLPRRCIRQHQKPAVPPLSQAGGRASRHLSDARYFGAPKRREDRGDEVTPVTNGRRGASLNCDNMNHRRDNAPVANCPQCGEVVSAQLARSDCTPESRALARRQQSVVCVQCGLRLIRP